MGLRSQLETTDPVSLCNSLDASTRYVFSSANSLDCCLTLACDDNCAFRYEMRRQVGSTS